MDTLLFEALAARVTPETLPSAASTAPRADGSALAPPSFDDHLRRAREVSPRDAEQPISGDIGEGPHPDQAPAGEGADVHVESSSQETAEAGEQPNEPASVDTPHAEGATDGSAEGEATDDEDAEPSSELPLEQVIVQPPVVASVADETVVAAVMAETSEPESASDQAAAAPLSVDGRGQPLDPTSSRPLPPVHPVHPRPLVKGETDGVQRAGENAEASANEPLPQGSAEQHGSVGSRAHQDSAELATAQDDSATSHSAGSQRSKPAHREAPSTRSDVSTAAAADSTTTSPVQSVEPLPGTAESLAESGLLQAPDRVKAGGEQTAPATQPAALSAPDARPPSVLATPTTSPVDAFGRPLVGASSPNGPSLDRMRLIERVSRAFRVAGDRDGRIRLRLSPPSLGSLHIDIGLRQGVLSARISAETAAARTALLDSLPELRDRLAQQQIHLERFDVDLLEGSLGGMPQAHERSQDQNEPSRPRSTVAAPADRAATDERAVRAAPDRQGSQLNVVV